MRNSYRIWRNTPHHIGHKIKYIQRNVGDWNLVMCTVYFSAFLHRLWVSIQVVRQRIITSGRGGILNSQCLRLSLDPQQKHDVHKLNSVLILGHSFFFKALTIKIRVTRLVEHIYKFKTYFLHRIALKCGKCL